jgi:hypothetical protein
MVLLQLPEEVSGDLLVFQRDCCCASRWKLEAATYRANSGGYLGFWEITPCASGSFDGTHWKQDASPRNFSKDRDIT